MAILFAVGLFPPSREIKGLSFPEGANYITAMVFLGFLSLIFRFNDGMNDGQPKHMCVPEGMLNIVQAHALWHVLGAGLLLVTYDYFARVSGEEGERIFGD